MVFNEHPNTKTDYKSIMENKTGNNRGGGGVPKDGVQPPLPPQDDYDDEDNEDDDAIIQKPVLHLYLLGWGLPLLVCSVIVSIAKGSYLTVPYAVCFTNNTPILLGSLLVPVCVLIVVKIAFICLICATLKRIVNDLKRSSNEDDDDEEAGSESRIKIENFSSDDLLLGDKLKLCESWAEEQEHQRGGGNNVENNNNNNAANYDDNADMNGGGGGGRGESVVAELKMKPRIDFILKESSSLLGSNGENTNNTGTGPVAPSNNYSEQTSVMDAQYKPNVQLKFAFISYLLMVIIWITGKCEMIIIYVCMY